MIYLISLYALEVFLKVETGKEDDGAVAVKRIKENVDSSNMEERECQDCCIPLLHHITFGNPMTENSIKRIEGET